MESALRRYKRSFSKRIERAVSNYTQKYWLIGDGRSGTTWVSNILNQNNKMKELFEPFHPWEMREIKQFAPNMYLRKEEENEILLKFYREVFEGKIYDDWVNRDGSIKRNRGLIVKDIYANLLMSWVITNFPNVKPIILIRNPMAVAASKLKTRRWHWQTDPLDFFTNKKLIEDHLEGFQELADDVKKRDDFVCTQVFIWCVINFVLLRSFDSEKVPLVFYEDIYKQPERETVKLFNTLGLENEEINEASFTKASFVSDKDSSIVNKKEPLTYWRETISNEQTNYCRHIMECFGLLQIYPDLTSPNESGLASFVKENCRKDKNK